MRGWIIFSNETYKKTYEFIRLQEACQSKNITVEFFYPEQFELIVTKSGGKSVLVDGDDRQLPDFIIPYTGSNTTYFTSAIIRQFEHLGVFCLNTADSINAVKDKLHAHQILAYSNLPTPKSMLVKFPINHEVVKKEIGFPVIIKNITGTEGNGIYLCKSEGSFEDLMELLKCTSANANIIMQEFIKESEGMDLRLFCLGGKVIGCMKRTSTTSFKANYSKGGLVEPFDLTPELDWLATEAARIFNLNIAGVDILIGKKGYKICEVNSAPGFKGLEKVTGKIIAEKMIDYIKVRLGERL